MSGFIGLISPELQVTETKLLDAAALAISSCCNDYTGAWASSQADLRFEWLKTVDDTADEHLPFTTDNNLHIIGDVRLDNREEILTNLNQFFNEINPSTPDVYLILYAYQHWGEDCLQHINGDYAFAIWDEQDSMLFCARDHFGIIPFYYAQLEGRFLFTNFYSALKDIPNLTSELNDDVLRNYWTTGINKSFDQTIYSSIQKLPPAHRLIYKKGKIEISRYWAMPTTIQPIRYKSNTDYISHFFRLFEKSIKDRTRTANVASQLSGGMDSPSITAMAKKVLDDSYGEDGTLVSFNIIYKYLVSENEGFFADLTAKKLNIPIKKYLAEDYLKNISQPLTSWLPEPVGIPKATAESQIVMDAQQFSRVLLTGFGGDPLFGYDPPLSRGLLRKRNFLQSYQDELKFYFTFGRLSKNTFKERIGKLIKKKTILNPLPSSWQNPIFFTNNHNVTESEKPSCRISAMYENPYWSWLFESCHPGFTGNGIKIRYPFFAKDIILFMAALPPHLLYRKYLLRMAMLSLLPEEVIHRPKTILFGNPLTQNLKAKEVLTALNAQLLDAKVFLKDKVDVPKLVSEIDTMDSSSESLRNILMTLNILAWKNYKV